jgi:tetratricopeptide (TPR) repeat protein
MPSEPAVAHHDSPRSPTTRVALCLRAIRGHLNLDLERPTDLGPLTVRSLAFSLPNLHFPVDLSGGVSRFRHRRGILELFELEAHLPRLAGFLTPRIRSAWPAPSPSVTILPANHGLVVGVADEHAAVGFQAWLYAEDQHLTWIVTDARGVGLNVPAHAVALRVAHAALSGWAERHGSAFLVPNALSTMVREVLIDAGARAPDAQDIAWTELHPTADGLLLRAASDAPPFVPPPEVIRAAALARIVEHADDALASGDLEHARAEYLAALEAAPKHPDIAIRIADLDLSMQAAPTSALASLVECMPAVDGGIVAARLLASVGDRHAASIAARRSAETEPLARLASFMFLEAASFATDVQDRLNLLDEAVARSPALAACRWARAAERLRIGDVATALTDFGSLEAAARGARARFEVTSTAADKLLDHHHPAEAAQFFERALRYAPRSIEATTGLARAFMSVGDSRRGAALLSRAVNLTARTPQPHANLLIELAKALADVASDLPGAIAHVRLVPFGLPQTVAARALEGTWRAALGDLDGATVAFGHARDAFEMLPHPTAAPLVSWLVAAAEFEERQRLDRRCAFRHIEAALRVCPDDPALRSAFRRLASASAQQTSAADAPPPAPPPPPPAEVAQPSPQAQDNPAADECRVDELTDRIRANPADHDAVLELCALLDKLGRDLDLFALVAARLEETTDPHVRTSLLPFKRAALTRLASTARAEGRPDEAAIYEETLAEMNQE